jgi:photosystem II stability/assembly factor-like uncharacterized protein
MHPDDVKAALDALASEVPAPDRGVGEAVGRGHTRLVRRRIALVSVAAVLVAAVAIVGLVGSDQHRSVVSTPVPTVSTRPRRAHTTPPTPAPSYDVGQYDPQPVVIGSANEAWICGDPMQLSADGGKSWREVHLPLLTGGVSIGEYVQPTLCTAAPGAAWILRATGRNSDESELIRIAGRPRHLDVFPLRGFGPATIVAINFIDSKVGWVVAQYQAGDSTVLQVYFTDSGGKNWDPSNMDAPLTLGVQGTAASGLLTFVNTKDGWGLGAGAQLERTTDGGYTWHAVPVPAISANGDFPTFVNGVFATGSTVVAWGGTGQRSENDYAPFFDVSTDGGHSWTMRSGPANLTLPLSLQSAFAANDADHWLLATDNRLFATDDGGQTWSLRAQFAGVKRIRYVAIGGAGIDYASGYGNLPTPSSVVLQTVDAGDNWTTVGFGEPPLDANAPVVNFPGGIVGCPTRPLTPPPPGNPPAGLVAGAFAYMNSVGAATPLTVDNVYRVGATPAASSFGSLFKFQVGSCGKATVANAWVVELTGPPGGASIDQTQLALAHYADGWHVFGRYH